MAEVARRSSTLPHTSRSAHAAQESRRQSSRPGSGDGVKTDMWSSMLDRVSSGKKLPEKSILVLGGTPELQKEFLEGLSKDPSSGRKPTDRQSNRLPPLANEFALGYTYHDVLDADHDDILARLSLYLLSDASPSFAPLLKPLFTPQSIPSTLAVIILDWSQPWAWLRQLRDWIQLLRSTLISLDDECQDVMEDNMARWKNRGREGGGIDGVAGDVSAPLGSGEWDEPLGIPLCVVCQNAEKIETLEKERGWKDEEFDFVLQFVRTVLLKHGASLIYTSATTPDSLQTLVHSSLNIQSLLKRQQLKHNVIDRDKVLVPPNWDSWGKIRVLREGFDVEGVSTGWSSDIEGPPQQSQTELPRCDEQDGNSQSEEGGIAAPEHRNDEIAIPIYEDAIRNPREDKAAVATALNQESGRDAEVETMDTQEFLAQQSEEMEKFKQEEQSQAHGRDTSREGSSSRQGLSRSRDDGARDRDGGRSSMEERGRVNDHIGPVQFNMGGIQVDADDMLKSLKDREATRTPEKDTSTVTSPDGKSQNEALASFFAGLMKRGGNSQTNSPR
ncbi:MAG: hypothetical protein M1837_005763 [Sclerophora amabilis]|nr:MAG: hypothetical protein M1837_005763 [Sclerophora amabilis]